MDHDCVVVGASFAGLTCAIAMARAGLRVTVLERKASAGEKLHTTGIIVKDAIDQIAILERLPPEMVRRVEGVRLYAPNLRFVNLTAPGYYFLTTDTPAVMSWLASEALQSGAQIRYQSLFRAAERLPQGFDLGEFGTTRYLVGADGPTSTVAKVLGLGKSSKFLFGVEHEYEGRELQDSSRLHCFIDRRLAPGYIGWIAPAPGCVQVGLARRLHPGRGPAIRAMESFLQKISTVFDVRDIQPASTRAGLLPCGGIVDPVAARNVLLTGDAAGMVSPVTAGGIHNAMKHGLAAGIAIAEYLDGRREDPGLWFVDSYPKFRAKRILRTLFDRFQSDFLFNALLHTRAVRLAASVVYFHHKGVFDPVNRAGTAGSKVRRGVARP